MGKRAENKYKWASREMLALWRKINLSKASKVRNHRHWLDNREEQYIDLEKWMSKKVNLHFYLFFRKNLVILILIFYSKQ